MVRTAEQRFEDELNRNIDVGMSRTSIERQFAYINDLNKPAGRKNKLAPPGFGRRQIEKYFLCKQNNERLNGPRVMVKLCHCKPKKCN